MDITSTRIRFINNSKYIAIASVTLDSKKVRRLGILSFEEYSIKEIETYSKNGIYNIDVYVNSNYDLYINDIKVSDDDLLSKEEIKE